MIRRIREQLVILINPVSNPDGRDKVVEWFYRFLKGKTDLATLPRQSPPYWSKYAFVDINRDSHQQTHETTKAVSRMFHEWHPTVVHDLHEGLPLMMTWNGTGPYNPAGGTDFPAGSWVLPSQAGLPNAVRDTARELGLDFTSVPAMPDVPRHTEKAPRIGVWVPWADTDSIGWIRYAFDQRRVPYTYLRDEDIRTGALRNRIDVLIYGHVDLELAEQIQGLPKIWGPMPFKKTAQTPSHGTPAESDDITGGIGWERLAQLQHFVEDGGLLVTLGSGSMLALDGGIVRGVRRVAGGVPRSTQGGGAASAAAAQQAPTRTPGAHVRVTFTRPDHPLAYGYPVRAYVFRQNFPLYDAPRRWLRMAYCTTCLDGPEDRKGIVLEWGDRDGAPFVVSGQAWGEEQLVGRPAILDMPVGHGHVVAFNFNPLHRDLNRSDHRLVWNAISIGRQFCEDSYDYLSRE